MQDFDVTRLKRCVGAAALALGVVLLGCAGSGARERPAAAANTLPVERAAALDRMLTSFADLGMFNGEVFVDQGGRIIFHRRYGLADYERGAGFRDRTRFRIASISKVMTDAALAALIAEGRMALADTVAAYLPDYPNGNLITIEHLVTHRSGIAHTNDQPWGDGSQFLTLDEIVARLAQTPLDFAPGQQRRYSNGGYAVLAKIMEVASGEDYAALMQRRVFDPLAMRDTGVIVDSRAQLAEAAVGYEPGATIGARRRPRPYLPETRPGGGSLYASARDVLTFFQAAYRDQMVGAREHPLLFGGQDSERGADGRAPGFYVDVYNDRTEDLIVVSVANNYAAEFRWAENIARLAQGSEPLFTGAPAADLRRPPDQRWIGRYDLRGSEVSISLSPDGHQLLLSQAGAAGPEALIPLTDGGYLEPLYYGVCRLSGDLAAITCNRLYAEGFVQELRRRD